MINIYIENIFNTKIDISKKLLFFQRKIISSQSNLTGFIVDDKNDIDQYKNQKLESHIIIQNIFNNALDEHKIKIIYSHNQNENCTDIISDLKSKFTECNIIPDIIEIEVEENVNNDLRPSLTFNFDIRNDCSTWLYNDISLKTITKLQIEIINQYHSQLETSKIENLGNTQSTVFTSSIEDNIVVMKNILIEYTKGTGIQLSLALAQFCLESDYGRSELAKEANNLFGIKTLIPYDKWFGTTWDHNLIYKKTTIEYEEEKKVTKVTNFRKYHSIEESIADYISYLSNSTTGIRLRYENINKCKDYKNACHMVAKQHYSTDPNYEKKLINIIEERNFSKYDEEK